MMSHPCLTVIFDGDCGLCHALRRQIQRRDTGHRLQFFAYQTAPLVAMTPGITPEMASRSVFAVRPDGRSWKGARAIFETLRCLPGGWRWVGIWGALPLVSLLAEPFYRLVARYRTSISRWLGLSQCSVGLSSNQEDTL